MVAQVVVSSMPGRGLQQEIRAGQYTLIADATKQEGGQELGPDPHQLVLAGLGACTSMTLQIFAQKRDWDLKKVNIKLREERIDDPDNLGRHISCITRDIEVEGDLDQKQLQKLKAIADKCPIHKLLVGHKTVVTNLLALNTKTDAACHVD